MQTIHDEEAQRNSALMLAYNGLTPRDIAECLGTSELQILVWLRREPDDTPPDDSPPQAA